MIRKIKNIYRQILNYEDRFNKIALAIARIERRQLKNLNSNNILDFEFKVTSQWGEDGILQHLVDNLIIENKTFVEFGVENFTESNTRYLLQNNNWKGLVLDGSKENISYIKKDSIYWKYNLKAEHAFINKENINDLISKNGINGDIGLLSIDIDGNDYWVWEAINCINPRIVICEYNSIFGSEEKISVPYKHDFIWTKEHYSNLYWGASLPALEFLGIKKGYKLIGVNSAGNNAFFVREDLATDLNIKTAKECYIKSSFRQSRNKNGKLTYLTESEGILLLAKKLVQFVDTNEITSIEKIFN